MDKDSRFGLVTESTLDPDISLDLNFFGNIIKLLKFSYDSFEIILSGHPTQTVSYEYARPSYLILLCSVYYPCII